MPDENKVSTINAKIQRGKDNNGVLRDRWLEYYKLYRNWRDQSGISGRSDVGVPQAFEWVEVVKARLFDIFAGKRPYLRTKGQEPNDDFPAQIVQQYQNYQYDLAGYRRMIYDVLTQILIYGTGIIKVPWKYEEREKFVDVPIFPGRPEFGSTRQKMKVPVYDNISFSLVDVFDFVVDPEATDLHEDAQWCAHKTRRTIDYLENMEERGIYKNIAAVRKELESEAETGGTETDRHKQVRSTIEGHLPDKNMMLKPVTLQEYWDKVENEVVVIANGKHLIREQDNPFEHGKFPFIVGKIISTPHEFNGIGLIEAGAPSARVMEDLLNNGLDSLNFSINPMLGVDQTRVEDTELVSRPGGNIHTIGDPNTVLRPIIIPDVSGGVLTWFQLMNELAKGGTGVNDYMIGQTSNSRTAREATLLASEAAKRIGLHIKVFGFTFIGPLAEMVHELNKQFTTEEQTIRVTGIAGDPYDETVLVTPDVFGANVDFIWESEDREMNNMMAVQQLMQALGIAQTHPILIQFLPIIFEKLLGKYDLHENDELKQAAAMAKEMAPLYQQLVLKQMATQIETGQAMAQAKAGGVGNAPNVGGGGQANNVEQSVGAQTNPSLGNSPFG